MTDDALILNLRHPKLNAAATMAEAADEIERLRSLITEWAEAHNELEDSGYWTDRYSAAGENLANAVGKDFN